MLYLNSNNNTERYLNKSKTIINMAFEYMKDLIPYKKTIDEFIDSVEKDGGTKMIAKLKDPNTGKEEYSTTFISRSSRGWPIVYVGKYTSQMDALTDAYNINDAIKKRIPNIKTKLINPNGKEVKQNLDVKLIRDMIQNWI
jgi:hypothetical protein